MEVVASTVIAVVGSMVGSKGGSRSERQKLGVSFIRTTH